jgi:hypothetical protein
MHAWFRVNDTAPSYKKCTMNEYDEDETKSGVLMRDGSNEGRCDAPG